jgi:hypothetical protein
MVFHLEIVAYTSKGQLLPNRRIERTCLSWNSCIGYARGSHWEDLRPCYCIWTSRKITGPHSAGERFASSRPSVSGSRMSPRSPQEGTDRPSPLLGRARSGRSMYSPMVHCLSDRRSLSSLMLCMMSVLHSRCHWSEVSEGLERNSKSGREFEPKFRGRGGRRGDHKSCSISLLGFWTQTTVNGPLGRGTGSMVFLYVTWFISESATPPTLRTFEAAHRDGSTTTYSIIL